VKRGDKLGRYELGDQIGEGAMAEVFASRHPVLERPVAIKVLKQEACHDSHYVARFLDDGRAAHGLEHPNIVRVLDVDEAAGRPFIVMERINGPSLDHWLTGRRLEVREAVRIARDLARALSAAHAGEVVHRDVKPSNILIDDKTGVAKLTDFGAAKRDRPGGQQLTEIGQRIGTPRYMAPEQVEGTAVDARTDLFALGTTLYELLAGRPAFEASSVSAAFHAILFNTPPSLAELRPDAPPELVSLVERLIAKAPDGRPSSAEEVVAVLDEILGVDATAAKAQVFTHTPAQPMMPGPETGATTTNQAQGGIMLRSRLVPAAAGVALLLVLGLGAWWWLSPGAEPDVALVEAPEAEAAPVPEEAVAEEPAVAESATPEPQPATAGRWQEEDTAEQPVEPETAAAGRWEEETATEEAAAAVKPETAAAGRWEEETAAEEPAAVEPEPEIAQLLPGDDAAAPAPPPAQAAPAAQIDIPQCPPDGQTPGCAVAAEALTTLVAAETPAAEPVVDLNRPDGIYYDQEYLVIEAALPPGVGGYVYMDVLTDAGNVYHLLPEPLRENNRLPPGGVIRVGVEADERQEGVRHWQVSGPFGEGYLLVLVSENPIYEGLRPEVAEPLEDYRETLLEAVRDPEIGVKAAHVQRVEFRPR
jgi:hypothetical protein